MSKISELSDGGSLLPTDFLIAVRSGANVKVKADQADFDRIRLGDNEKIELGNSQDLTLVHTATQSIINQAGTGDLLIQKAGTTKASITANGLEFPDNSKAIFGAGSDLQIYSDGTTGQVTGNVNVTGSVAATGGNFTGQVQFDGTAGVQLDNGAQAHTWVLDDNFTSRFNIGTSSAGATWKFGSNNNAYLAVSPSGIDVTGTVTADGLTVDGNASLSNTSVNQLNISGLTKITGVRGTFVDPSEDSSIPNIFATNDAVGDFSQEAGHLVIQPRVHPTVFRDVVFAGGAGTTKRLMTIQGEGNLSLYEDTGTTPKFFWDSSAESLGIGTSSPSSILSLSGTDTTVYSASSVGGQDSSATLKIQNLTTAANSFASIDFNTNNNRVVNRIVSGHGSSTSDGFLAFVTEGSGTPAERMRILSTGSVLFGQSLNDRPAEFTQPSGASIAGATGHLHGQYQSSVSGMNMLLNRKGTDGTILGFRKDGADVGSIQSRAGLVTTLILDPRSSGAGISGGGAFIYPTNNVGALSDNVCSLGSSSQRFKDLYLAGGVYLGGTGAANKLDDYETGTWTPVDDSGAALTFTTPTGKYTKIGNKVYVSCHIVYPTTASTANIKIGGLPFGVGSSQSDRSGLSVSYTTYTTPVTVLGESNTTNVELFSFGGVRRTNADLSAKVIYIGGFYEIE